ncbi:MAG TPA: sulfite exporter TauE/SafE family protein [Xanthobacteraceae bacterium]|nr:sulfite exporter TauE/SafE family protein [Xanthobacteraceae bacterium]
MPDLETIILLFVAGCVSWTISTFSGGAGSIVLLAAVTQLIRVKTIAPVITIASLIASPTRILVSWRLIEWPVVRWYLPGAMCGAIIGSWIFTRAGAVWLGVIVGLFLISTPIQYRLGGRARSFPMRLPWFIPVSLVVGLISGVIGASSLVSVPFYLNYGLTKERMIATGALHSLFIQLTKIATYGSLGVMTVGSVLEGASAGLGAVVAILVTRRWLDAFKEIWFRRLAIVLMLISGFSMLWRSRGLFF